MMFTTLLACAALSVPAAHDHAQADPGTEWVHACWPIDESGTLTGTRVPMRATREAAEATRLLARGVGDNRLDMVFVGDGYTAAELGLYAMDVDNVVANFFRYEPFTSYEPYFRVTRIDVVSAQSGVDNDPTQGVLRNTALDMAYWCGGTERLLCVNVNKAYSFANQAVDVDQVLAVANSTKYGGAGYPSSNLGTLAGRNGSAVEIAIHEMGHSLGDLADEYDYGGPATYTGGERPEANASILQAAAMQSQQRKWWRWIGYSNSRFDGPVGTFEGAHYSVFGVYRPSNNSNMRALFRKFNAPSAEALIRNIYLEVSPIDGVSPATANVAVTAGAGDTLSVTPMRPNGHTLSIRWSVGGSPVPALNNAETATSAALGLDGLPDGTTTTVTATVVDPTDMVRDEAMRASLMTDSWTWTVTVSAPGPICDADLNGDGVADFGDVGLFVTAFAAGSLDADITGDGVVDFGDVSAFITLFNQC